MILYRLYQFFIALPLLLVLTAIVSIVTTVGCTVGNAAFWSYWPPKLWSKAMCAVLLLPVHIEGKENLRKGQSYVIVPNHQGAFDIFLVYGYIGRSFKWMMKKSLRNIPLVGRACESAGHIFVDNSGPKAVAATMAHARQVLTSGVSLVAFPEGQRTLTGRLGTFRRGAFQLASELQLPIVPIVIRGSYKVLPRQRGFWFVNWARLSMTIYPPISPANHTPEELRTQAHSVIAEALGEATA